MWSLLIRLRFRLVGHLKMTFGTSVLWKTLMKLAIEWPEMVVKWSAQKVVSLISKQTLQIQRKVYSPSLWKVLWLQYRTCQYIAFFRTYLVSCFKTLYRTWETLRDSHSGTTYDKASNILCVLFRIFFKDKAYTVDSGNSKLGFVTNFVVYVIKQSPVSPKMFTNERLFTIQAFTITRVHCIC